MLTPKGCHGVGQRRFDSAVLQRSMLESVSDLRPYRESCDVLIAEQLAAIGEGR